MGRRRRTIGAAAGAAAIALVMRLTVFTDDCNLLIMGATFLLSFALILVAIAVSRKLRREAPGR